jgi:hypothetical protein
MANFSNPSRNFPLLLKPVPILVQPVPILVQPVPILARLVLVLVQPVPILARLVLVLVQPVPVLVLAWPKYFLPGQVLLKLSWFQYSSPELLLVEYPLMYNQNLKWLQKEITLSSVS